MVPEPPKTVKEKDSSRLVALTQTNTFITAAFSLVAALAWNDAIQSLFKRIFGEAASLYAKFFYAIIVTVVIVLVTLHLAKVTRALEKKLGKE